MSLVARITLLLTTACALTACGGDSRPSADEWTAVWEDRQALVPDAAEIIEGGQDVCGERLGVFRIEFPALLPSPAKDLDAAVEAWAAHAETLVFECPTDAAELDRRYEALDLLVAEVDAGLVAESG